MKKGQLTVNDLIILLQLNFDGDEPVWYRVNDDPYQCYMEVWEKDVQRSGVWIGEDDDERLGQCVIGDFPV